MALIKMFRICETCDGTGGTGLDGKGNPLRNCPDCQGDGVEDGFDDTLLQQIITKLDAIKAMLDSPTLGMQKTSSNLDDIMVKLDV